MVTEMDRASEALITERLLGARPDDGILGEEGVDTPGTSGVRWVVDPLDGTTNYLYGFPGFNVSIAAEVDGQTVAGAVYDVVRDELFSAAAGGGATARRRTDPRLRRRPTSARPWSAPASPTTPDRRRRPGRGARPGPAPRPRHPAPGAAALDLCSVACGRLDAYYERGLAPWDLAAGGLIARRPGPCVHVTRRRRRRRGRRGRRPGHRGGPARPARPHRRSPAPDARGDGRHRPDAVTARSVTRSQPERHLTAGRARHAASPMARRRTDARPGDRAHRWRCRGARALATHLDAPAAAALVAAAEAALASEPEARRHRPAGAAVLDRGRRRRPGAVPGDLRRPPRRAALPHRPGPRSGGPARRLHLSSPSPSALTPERGCSRRVRG